MRYLLPAIFLLAVGCDSTPDPNEEYASQVCAMFCTDCQPTIESCEDDCFNSWSTFAGHETKHECSDRFLGSVICKVENSCDDPQCGSAVEIMFACAEEADNRSATIEEPEGDLPPMVFPRLPT